MLLEVKAKKLIKTLVKIKTKAIDTATTDPPSEVEAKTLNDTLVKVKAKLPVDALADMPRQV